VGWGERVTGTAVFAQVIIMAESAPHAVKTHFSSQTGGKAGVKQKKYTNNNFFKKG
jgi:hypothetical protein